MWHSQTSLRSADLFHLTSFPHFQHFNSSPINLLPILCIYDLLALHLRNNININACNTLWKITANINKCPLISPSLRHLKRSVVPVSNRNKAGK